MIASASNQGVRQTAGSTCCGNARECFAWRPGAQALNPPWRCGSRWVMRGRSGDAPSAGRVSVECTRRARPIAQPLAMTVGSIPTVVAPNGGAGQVESEQVDKPADAEERGGANSAQSSTWLSVLAGTSANPFVEE